MLVHNPSAGSGQPTPEALLAILDDAGFSTSYFSSKDDAYKEALARGDAEIVIVAGGDGTISKVARSIPDRKVLIGVLPLGTANNVARSLGITGKVEAVVKSLRGAPVKRLDIGGAAGPWGKWHFLESVGWGALAKAVGCDGPELSRDRKIEWGRDYFAGILAEAEPRHVSFEADGRKIEGDFLFVEILNVGMTGPRVLISPAAEPTSCSTSSISRLSTERN
ncbi:MAG: diacylglycerol/lipid kinase family protein [Methyloceanibacter sp.]|uniref:diacylglycerol/lipid kinase family protein n=1 Tax=Methyloceanibacter sp. TaxID=1965321 RepID=UPI003D6CCDD7